MKADYCVVLDANVLADSVIGDLFLWLATEPRMISPKWSESILNETRRTLTEKLKWRKESVDSRLESIQAHFPEAMIRNIEPFIDQCENHEKDRHVLATAIRGNVETIITANIRDFRSEYLEKWGIDAIHPSEYLIILYELNEGLVMRRLYELAKARNKPFEQILSRISMPASTFAEHVSQDIGLDFPEYNPATYRDSKLVESGN